jgi:tetratricopeptide (TPR) repeat protein
LGWAYLAQDLGTLAEAEQHATKAFRAALRCGRKTEAAQAYHALASILIHQGRLDEAWIHARNAVASYPSDNPRFPALAHDIAFLWSRQGFFADAAVIYEKVLPSISKAEERLVVLANIARAGAAARDQLRYERAAREVLRALHEKKDVPTSALYHLARAAVNIGDWSRAKLLADKIPPQQAPRWKKMLDDLYSDIQSRSGRDPDLIPEYGSEIYDARELLLAKLESYADPSGRSAGSATSEKYPIS